MKNDGGTAFPVYDAPRSSLNTTGMTLRDYFAAKAVQGMRFNNIDQSNASERLQALALAADIAYEMADAMLSARGDKC